MALQIRKGADAERRITVFASGEPVYCFDTKKLYIGDGTTPGGVQVSGIDRLTDIGDVSVGDYPEIAVSLVSCVGGVLTVTAATEHGMSPGQSAVLQVDGNRSLNGTYEITGTPDSFTIVLDGPLLTLLETTDSGYIQRLGANASDRAILVYDQSSDQWIAGVLALAQLGDVNFAEITLEQNDRLAYDASTQSWTAVTGDLDSLNDVTLSSVTVNDLLLFDGTAFINKAHNVSNISDTDIRELADQQALLYDEPSQTWRPRRPIKAKEPGIFADLFIGSEQDGRDSQVIDTYLNQTYPNTTDAKWGSASAYFGGNGRLQWQGEHGLGIQKFTLLFWMNTDDQDYGTFRSTKQIFSPLDTASDDDHAFFVGRRMAYGSYVPSDAVPQFPGAVTLSTAPESGTYYIVGSGNAVIDDGQWHLIVISRESDYIFTTHVDGVLRERRTQPRLIEFFNHGGLNIGGNYGTSSLLSSSNYRGYIDDVQLYVGTALYEGLDEFVVPYWPSLGRSTFYGDGISQLGDVDTETISPVSGSVLQWNGMNWVPGVTSGGRGDPGDYDTGLIDSGFIFSVRGGGDFDTAATDEPIEELQTIVDAGDFD